MNHQGQTKNHDNHHDKTKMRTLRFSKLPDYEDPWAPKTPVKPRWAPVKKLLPLPTKMKRLGLQALQS